MGRRKLEIKRIKDKSSRLVAFSKRRTGLFKKARQLSVLCDVDVAVVVFSDSGKLYDFCSGGANKYQKLWFVGQETTTQEGACQDIGFSNPCTRFRTCHQLLQSVTRVDEEPNEVSVTDMVELEEELSSALMHIRSRKNQMMMDRISTFHENEKKLTQQNLQLKQNQQVAESEQKDDVEIDVNDGDGDGGGDVVELAKDDNYQTNTSSFFTLPLFKE